MASEITQRQRAEADDEQMFEMFLIENGWTSVGYSLTYYPEWLKLMTFPCYERIGGKWTMKPEKRLELDEWLKGCRQVGPSLHVFQLGVTLVSQGTQDRSMKLGRRPIEAVNGHLQCKACGQIRPLEKFPVCKRAVCGRRSTCNLCRAETRRSTRVGIKRGCRKSPITAVGEKWCYACCTIKPLVEYRKNRRMKDGYSSECNECGSMAATLRNRRKRAIEYAASSNASADEWMHHLCNRHLIIQSNSVQAIRARRKLLTFQCVHCGQTIEAMKKRKFCGDNCVWASASRHRKYMRRLRMGNRATQDRIELMSLLERDEYKCGICDDTIDLLYVYPHPLSATIDHVRPLSKGGLHKWSNVQAAHARCNLRKHAKVQYSS